MTPPLPTRRRSLLRTRIRTPQLITLFQQLHLLLAAGILVGDALALLADKYPDRRVRRVFRSIHHEVTTARCRVSAAFKLFPRTFSPSALAVIAAGEEGGALALAQRFSELAERLRYESDNGRQLRRACAYPSICLVLTGALLTFVVRVTVPRIEELLRSMGGQLPPLTRAVIAAARTTRSAAPALLSAGAAMTILFTAARQWRPARSRVDRLLLRLPVAGTIYRDLAVALVCKIYRSLYLASQTAPDILALCVPLVGNERFRESLREAQRHLTEEGLTLSSALERSGAFPPIAVLTLHTGEQTGRLADALDHLSAFFQLQARLRMDAWVAAINPLLTLLAVGVAGVMLAAFFQALYQIVYAAH